MNRILFRAVELIPDNWKRKIKYSWIYGKLRKSIFSSKESNGEYAIRGGLLRNYTIFTDPERTGYILGFYELDITQILKTYCRPGMVVCDIGAHHGYFSMLMAKLVTDSGNCFAFEANKSNYERILHSVSANGIQNLIVENMAVSNQSGQAEIRLYPGYNSMGRLTQYVGSNDQPLFSMSEIVPSITLDEYFEMKGDRQPGLMKIDVEGAEDVVVDGGIGIISRDKPVIVMEVHRCSGVEIENVPVVARLIKLGYDLKELQIDQEIGENKHVLLVAKVV